MYAFTALVWKPRNVAGLCGAVKSLQQQLRERGSNLLILEGKAAEHLPQLAEQYNASSILTEEEVEYRYTLEHCVIKIALPLSNYVA